MIKKILLSCLSVGLIGISGCDLINDLKKGGPKEDRPAQGLVPSANFPVIQLPGGYEIEKVAGELTYPTSGAWDDEGRMYVVEAGGAFMDQPAPARILRIENGGVTVVADNLEQRDIHPPIAGMVWHKGALYLTHRAKDRKGAVSRMAPDGGTIIQLFKGVVDSQTDHFLNDIRVARTYGSDLESN